MTKPRSDTQHLLDRAAIHDVLVRYFQGIDLGNEQQVRDCFTADIQANYHGRPFVRGIDALIASIPSFAKQASGEWIVSTHFMGNLHYKFLEGDVAETENNGFAFLVLAGQPADQVAMRSLRYLDKWRRVDAQWRISERLHTLDWACQVPTTFATPLAQRKGFMPARMP